MHSIYTLLRTNPKLIAFGFVIMFFTSPGQTYFISLFSGEIRSNLNLSHGEFGAIYSLATLASAFVLLKTGSLIDKVALPRIIALFVFLLAIACALMANSHAAWSLCIVIFLLRHMGQGLMSMTSSSAMMRYAGNAKAKANSISNMGYSVAEAVLPSCVVLLLLVMSWREAWYVTGLALAFIALPLLIYLANNLESKVDAERRRSEHTAADDESMSQRQWTRSEVLGDPYFYLLTPALLSQSLLYTGFMFHQVHLVAEKAWSLSLWASLYALFSLTAIVTSLFVGALADRIGAVRLAPFVTLPMALGLCSLAAASNTVVAVIFMFCMGISTGAQSALSAPFYAERYGTKNFGSIKSLASFVMVIMTAISPFVLGWFIDQGVSIEKLALCFAIYAFIIIAIAMFAAKILIASQHSHYNDQTL